MEWRFRVTPHTATVRVGTERKPSGRALDIRAVAKGNRRDSVCDHAHVDEAIGDQGVYEVAVLFAECAQLCYAEVFLIEHQPMNCGWPPGAAVFSFCTLTSRVRQPSGRAEVVRSTPSMLKP